MRRAAHADLAPIEALQALSMQQLGKAFYDGQQIESFLQFMPMMERYLIGDGTYFVAELDDRIVGCGGWSARAPGYQLSGPDTRPDVSGAARVRAMYVHPAAARRGIGRTLLETIESEMIRAGHEEATLEAILPGAPLYRHCGYVETAATHVEFPNGVHLPVIRMRKRLPVHGGTGSPG